MYSIKQPPRIVFGENSAQNYEFQKNCLLITSKGAKSRDWINYIGFNQGYVFDNVEPNPAMVIVEKILSEFEHTDISCIVGLGGGSSLDVAKYVGYVMKKPKIMIPTTFGSGSEVTRISVLKINNKKQSFHNDALIADSAIIDPFFIKNTPFKIIRDSAIDACAQCTEGFDSKIGNAYTKFLCGKAFDILEDAIITKNYQKLPLGSLITGLGFGNCSTTLGHALSYVFSNEGISHGHALAFTTSVAHIFNNSKFYQRFLKLVSILDFPSISLKGDLMKASELILNDKKHLDNNPKPVTKQNIITLLKTINSGNVLNEDIKFDF